MDWTTSPDDDVNWTAQWIWIDGEPAPRNRFMAARRQFTIRRNAADAERRLHIAADTRYRLYLNGRWFGDGPNRSFHFNQQFDTYDVTGLLEPGRNTLAILVNHFGEGTFQYQPSGRAGLLVQLERRRGKRSWTPELVTDGDWRVRPHDGYIRPTMRISCQQPFEEIFDARRLPADWTEPGGSDEGFAAPVVIGPAGCDPWPNLTPRDIPFLTRTPVRPSRLWRAGLSRPANFHTGFSLRRALLPGYLEQSAELLPGFAATLIVSPVEQQAEFWRLSFRHEPAILNGRRLPFGEHAQDMSMTEGVRVTLRAGENLFVAPIHPGHHHEFDRTYVGHIEQPVELRGVFQDASPWTVFGPFGVEPGDGRHPYGAGNIPPAPSAAAAAADEDLARAPYHEVFPRILEAATPADLEPLRGAARPLDPADVIADGSPWDETTAARFIEETPPVENIAALFSDSPQPTVVHPPADPDHAVELFLDFGREQIGWLELELDAPEGVELDCNVLEEIEDGRRIHYTYGAHLGMRYITRAGGQHYVSALRRGFRYCKLTLRNVTAPVRLRRVGVVFAAYPAAERGDFRCSDDLLNRIWQVGRHTLLCCSEDTYTDCPTYEQTYWVGDGRNEALVDYAAYGNGPLARRCSLLPAESLFRSKLPESQVPSGWVDILTAWSLLWVQMVEEYWRWSGDRDFLRQAYPAIRQTLLTCRDELTDARGLLSIRAWNMFDWAGIDQDHMCVTHNSMFLVEAYRRGEALARVVREAEDVNAWHDAAGKLIEAINTHLWDDARGAYFDSIHDDGAPSSGVSQQVNALAILYDIAPPDRLERIRDVVTAPPEGMTRVGSPFALFYMLESLIHQGRHAELLKVVRERWGEMIRHGATTFWEVFPGRYKDWWTRSYCHAWSAAPVYFLSRYQLGAWLSEPGYRKARIAPIPLDLTWAEGRVPTPNGEIQVAWAFEGETFRIDVALPEATAATLELPVDAVIYPDVKVVATPAPGAPAHTAATLELTPQRRSGKWTLELPAGIRLAVTARRG